MNLDEKVTICIPVYNMESSVAATIESAINQTYGNIEILVLDNCSTDNTFSIAAQYARQGVRVEKNARNLGVYGNHNRCILLAEGKWIKFLHGDDLLHSDAIEYAMNHLSQLNDENIGLVWFPAIKNIGSKKNYVDYPKQVTIHRSAKLEEIVYEGNFTGTPSMTMISSAYCKQHDFNLQLNPYSDGPYFLDLKLRMSTLYLNKPLVTISDDVVNLQSEIKNRIGFFNATLKFISDISKRDAYVNFNKLTCLEFFRYWDMSLYYLLKYKNGELLKEMINKAEMKNLINSFAFYLVNKLLCIFHLQHFRSKNWISNLNKLEQ